MNSGLACPARFTQCLSCPRRGHEARAFGLLSCAPGGRAALPIVGRK